MACCEFMDLGYFNNLIYFFVLKFNLNYFIDICVENCAICRNHIMELCIEAQADGGAGGTNATCDTRMSFNLIFQIVYQYQNSETK